MTQIVTLCLLVWIRTALSADQFWGSTYWNERYEDDGLVYPTGESDFCEFVAVLLYVTTQ